MIDIGPWKPDTCPNSHACPHDLEQHLFNPRTERWECTVEDCGDNPDRTVTVWPSSLSFSSSSRLIEQAREVHGPDIQVGIGEYAPGGIIRFPRSVSPEQVERFKAAFNEAYPRGVRYEVERPEPHPTRWIAVVYAGMAVAVIALAWLTLVLVFASSQALTLPAVLALVGALITGVGVFGPDVERRRRRSR